jgi:hypothetical protein
MNVKESAPFIYELKDILDAGIKEWEQKVNKLHIARAEVDLRIKRWENYLRTGK